MRQLKELKIWKERKVYQAGQLTIAQANVFDSKAFLDEWGELRTKANERYLVQAELLDFVWRAVLFDARQN